MYNKRIDFNKVLAEDYYRNQLDRSYKPTNSEMREVDP